MKLARKLVIAAAVAAPLLAGASPAMAATARPAGPAAAGIRWFYWDSYPTQKACNTEGDHLFLAENILTWKCVEASGGEFLVWQLYVVLGHPPGS
jgi:hypothetical protein